MATPEQPLVTQADIDAYIAQYQKAQADQAAALAAAQATGLSDQYTQLYGGADIVPGMTQGILSSLGIANPYVPVYTLRGSANTGGNNANERMSFAPLPGTEYRLVDKNTGQTMTASTPEEIKTLAETANALSKSGGAAANYAIESGQGGNFSTMFEDTPDIDKFNRLAAMALPVVVSMIPGLQGVGAVLANAGAGAAGAAITGADPLKGAIMGGLTSAGTQFLPAPLQSVGVGADASKAIGAGIGATAGGVATGQSIDKSLLGGLIAGGSTYLGNELFGGGQDATQRAVEANIRDALGGLEGGLFDVGASAADLLAQAYQGQGAFSPDGIKPLPWAGNVPPSYPSNYVVSGTPTSNYTPFTPNVNTFGPNIDITAIRDLARTEDTAISPPVYTPVPSDYVVTADSTKPPINETNTTAIPLTLTNVPKSDYVVTADNTTPPIKDTTEYTGSLPNIPSLVDDIVQRELSGDTKPKDKVTDTISDVIKYAGTAGTIYDLIKRLLGGGGDGTVPGMPYVSPFGTGTGVGVLPGVAGRTQVAPNIADYERYGFGPEAAFFSGVQSGPVTYKPLI